MFAGMKLALVSLVLGAISVRGALDENIKMGNRTIERVSGYSTKYLPICV